MRKFLEHYNLALLGRGEHQLLIQQEPHLQNHPFQFALLPSVYCHLVRSQTVVIWSSCHKLRNRQSIGLSGGSGKGIYQFLFEHERFYQGLLEGKCSSCHQGWI